MGLRTSSLRTVWLGQGDRLRSTEDLKAAAAPKKMKMKAKMATKMMARMMRKVMTKMTKTMQVDMKVISGARKNIAKW